MPMKWGGEKVPGGGGDGDVGLIVSSLCVSVLGKDTMKKKSEGNCSCLDTDCPRIKKRYNVC